MTREKVEGKEFVDLNTWNNILRRKENLDLFTSIYSSCVTSLEVEIKLKFVKTW
jgi:hypothetical protein